jgi:uncharacterized protein
MCLASIVMTDVAIPAIVDFSATAPETTTSKPTPDRLLGGNPEHVARNYFSDSTGRFFAGVWESTPGRWRVRYTENEFCHITRGRVRIEDGAGNHWSFGPGASFVIPTGFSGVWNVIEPLSKLYVIYEPASS